MAAASDIIADASFSVSILSSINLFEIAISAHYLAPATFVPAHLPRDRGCTSATMPVFPPCAYFFLVFRTRA
jgi:hypothetical protein